MVAVAVLSCITVLLPVDAFASSSGEITRAVVTGGWESGSFAGTAIRANHCEEVPEEREPRPPGEPGESSSSVIQPSSAPWECGWIAYATLGPGSSSSDCSSPQREWGSLGAGVQLVWTGEELDSAGSSQFDLPNVDLQYGGAAPLLCLSAVESYPRRFMCIGGPEERCERYVITHRTYQLDSALLEPSSVTESPVSPPAQASPQDITAPPAPYPRSCRGKKHRHHRQRVKARARGRHSHKAVAEGAPRHNRCGRH